MILAFSFFGVCLWLVSEDEATALDHGYDIRDRVGRIFRAQASPIISHATAARVPLSRQRSAMKQVDLHARPLPLTGHLQSGLHWSVARPPTEAVVPVACDRWPLVQRDDGQLL